MGKVISTEAVDIQAVDKATPTEVVADIQAVVTVDSLSLAFFPRPLASWLT